MYDIRDDVFGCGASPDADKLATYGIFMSKVITENYNRSNDWIFANSQPKGGVIMPSDKYALKKNFVRSLGSTAAQEDEDFFYNKGGCYHANNLEIYQLDDKGERSFDIFKKGLFKGNLRAVKLHADEYSNPMALEPSQQALSEYDIRQKAGYIFNDFEDFKKYFTAKGPAGPSILNITEGGVYYFDSPAETDLTQSGQIKEIIFHQNTMLIFKSGVKLPKISKSPAAFENKCTMSIISMEGNLTISGSQIAASLCALKGSILKNTDYFQVFGNMVMGGIDFDLSKNGNLFRAAGASPSMVPVLSSVNSGKTIEGFNRVCVIYDPALNPCDIKNYRRHYKYHIASKKTYWKVAND